MRWGVRDEMTNEHMTTELCMTELKNCQRLSMGPNFIYFGATKYGYRPIPTEIISSELDELREEVIEVFQAPMPMECQGITLRIPCEFASGPNWKDCD